MSLIQDALEKAGRAVDRFDTPLPTVEPFLTISTVPQILVETEPEPQSVIAPQGLLRSSNPASEIASSLKALLAMTKESLKKIPFDYKRDVPALAAVLAVLLCGVAFLGLFRKMSATNFSLTAPSLATGVP